jgi:type III restriction enzyme
MTAPKSLIVNSPYRAPTRHWEQGRDGSLQLREGRRSAGYEIFDTRNNTRRSEPLDLVNTIRTRVDAWREADCAGITSVTRRLLEHWRDPDVRQYPFYFCQVEAIETLIWWVEAPAEHKQGIHVPGDGGAWERLCCKMATGAGKTVVMAMIVTWQVLNALAYPRRNRDFSRALLFIAPGLTVRERLHVLQPGAADNFYDAFSLCPSESMRQQVNRAEVLVENWHTLMPLKEAERSVVKKGAESDQAFARRVLGKLADYRDLVVVNDEAHHAYRVPAESKISRSDAAAQGFDLDEATRWVEGLDRINRTRRIQRCFDLSATPFAPTGKVSTEVGLMDWIVSDFGLNDAIEAGLVKTPRVVIRDDGLPSAATYRSKLYHLYREADVSEDLNRRAQPHETLPALVQNAYTLLGADWRETRRQWQQAGHVSPPVMLTVCNRTETAARVEHYFDKGGAQWPELHAPERTLRVDSRVLDKAEIGESAGTDKDYEARLRDIVAATPLSEDRRARLDGLKKEELLREMVDNVGKPGTAGQALQNVISVAMLSEGWDAKNVTHIMGLRAFTSQLLCEQVIGRGLRRVAYDTDSDGFFLPEYVNVFGVPLSIFQDVGEGGEAPPPPKPSVQIEALPERNSLEIRWPNVLRVDAVVRPTLHVDWSKVEPLVLDPARTVISADIAPAVGGAADVSRIHEIDLEALPEEFRLQRLVFKAARHAFESMRDRFCGTPEYLVAQLVRLVETFVGGDRLVVPSLFHQDPLRRRILLALNADLIVQHLMRHVEEQNLEHLEPVFDEESPIGMTSAMRVWYTTKPCQPTKRSQINQVVFDSTWEKFAADLLERHDRVLAYAKNDHLGFHVQYLWNGATRRYVPDFLVRLANGRTLILETKGQDSQQNQAKRSAMDAWVMAVSAKGGFGAWCSDVAYDPAALQDVLARHS